ncbi:hypothetical protein SOVF_187890 isoform A [Spinacia oleracea]|nr:hypothetical protein SOVF_187890 isoform A [Spinacia oleracea]
MMTKSWPALQSCDNKVKRKEGVTSGLCALPDEILFSILSSFTMKEVARLSVVSHRWKYIWENFPRLHFEDSRAMERILESPKVISDERSNFVTWVSRVVDQHFGVAAIDELRIKFCLTRTYQSHVDKWAVFASEKQVKTLDLNFTSKFNLVNMESAHCTFPLKVASIKSSLISLCLRSVDVTDEFIGCLVCSCIFLEKLCVGNSKYLTNLRVSSSLQRLKHLEVTHCSHLKIIDISTPNLVSFTYYGRAIELHIRHASWLSKVAIGSREYNASISYAFDSLLQYSSQLEYLSLMINLKCESNIQIINPPALTNVKHIELYFIACCNKSLLGWTSLIVAAPVLQKLTLKLYGFDIKHARPIAKHNACRCPLKCLKTLEIVGFMGRPIDLEFAAFVLENAIALEEVIVDFPPMFRPKPYHKGARECLVELKTKLPPGVKLIVK